MYDQRMRGLCTLVSGAIAVAACFSPDIPDGQPCGDGGACPSGQMCDPADNLCHRDAPCPPGFQRGDSECLDIDECTAGTADCSADATCLNMPGSFACECRDGFEGDGRTCTRVCTTALIYSDCITTSAECMSIPDALLADNAAQALGLEVLDGGVGDQPAWRMLFDDGGFDVLIVESALNILDPMTINRIEAWASSGGRIVFSHWDLDAIAPLQNALGVTTGTDFTMPPDVYPDPEAPELFDLIETVPSPLSFSNPYNDDGDELTPAAGGYLAAHHTAVDGPGAIAVTNDGHAVVVGFLPFGLVFEGPADADNDNRPDAEELYTNLIGTVCGYSR